MATNQTSPTEITRGTLPKNTEQPLKDMGVSDNIQPEAPVGTPNPMQTTEDFIDNVQPTQQTTQDYLDNAQPTQIGEPFKAKWTALGEPMKKAGTAIGQPVKQEATDIGEPFKKEAPSKEPQQIEDYIDGIRPTTVQGYEIQSPVKEKKEEPLVDLEMSAQNQELYDGIIALDGQSIIDSLRIKDVPRQVKDMIIASDEYKAAVRDKNVRKTVDQFNKSVSGEDIVLDDKPEVSKKEVKDNLGIESWDVKSEAEVSDMVKADDMKNLSGEIGELDDEIAQLQQESKNLKDNITKEFPTSISKQALNAIIYDRQNDINNQLQTKLATRESKVMDYERRRKEKELEIQRSIEERRYQDSQQWKQLEFDYRSGQDKQNLFFKMRDYDMKLDQQQWEREYRTTQRQWSLEDRAYLANQDMNQKIMSTMEGKRWVEFVSKMRRLEAETGEQMGSFIRSDGSFGIYNSNTWDIVDNYVPYTPEQKRINDGLVNFARANEWVPYVWWGVTAKQETQVPYRVEKLPKNLGVDCSGLLVSYGRQAGVISDNERPTAQVMYNESTEKPLDSLQQGDLIYYKDTETGKVSHVGIAMWPIKPDGSMNIIDASINAGKVSQRDIKVKDGKLGKYEIVWANNFLVDRAEPERQECDMNDFVWYNSLTNTAKSKLEWSDLDRYNSIGDSRRNILNNKDSSVYQIVALSEWQWSWPTQWEREKLTSFRNAIDDVQDLNNIASRMDTGPVLWRLAKMDPYNVNAAAFNAAINGSVPNVARGVFGEVGVLTDSDVARYTKVLPNLTSTDEQNKAIQAILLTKALRGYEENLRVMAASKVDVSWFGRELERLEGAVDNINQQIWVGSVSQNEPIADTFADSLGTYDEYDYLYGF